MKVPIVRKVVTVGGSRGMTFPKSWIDYIENETGEPLENVAVEVNGHLIIHPMNNKHTKKGD